MHVYICVFVCMCNCMCMYMLTYANVYYMHACMCIISKYVYIDIQVCMYVCVYTYVNGVCGCVRGRLTSPIFDTPISSSRSCSLSHKFW